MKHTKIILDPMYGGCGGVILAKCENCTNKLPSCYEEDCGVQNDANAALAQYEAITHDKDDNEVISLARLRELASAEREGRVVVLPVAIGTPVYIVHCFPAIKFGDCVMEFIGEPIEEYPFVIDMLPLWGEEIFATKAEAERALAAADAGKG